MGRKNYFNVIKDLHVKSPATTFKKKSKSLFFKIKNNIRMSVLATSIQYKRLNSCQSNLAMKK